jgi:putative oxygen-independent coproporphyrinogen III oxidase
MNEIDKQRANRTQENQQLPKSQATPKLVVVPEKQPRANGAAHISAAEVLSRVTKELEGVDNKDLMIYIHIPFCNSKCTFCDWVTDIPVAELRSGPSTRNEYGQALCQQIRFFGPRLMDIGYTPKLIYWGGGTPSKLEAGETAEVIAALHDSFDLSHVEEHAVEISPESITAQKLETMRSLGVNRISMGVQSFDDVELRKGARSHSAAQAEAAARLIKEAGFRNFNLDLIVAFPDQTLDVVEQSVSKAIELEPTHLSIYMYRPDPDTVMAQQIRRGYRKLVGIEQMLASDELSKALIEKAGYFEYMLGYYAKEPEHRFKGEEYYFSLQGDYIGFGSGAGSILGHHSLSNVPGNLHKFMAHPLEFDQCGKFSPRQPFDDGLRAALLTSTGINFHNFKRLFGFDFAEIRNQPSFEAGLDFFRRCGAVFEETKEYLTLTDESRHKAYINSYAMSLSYGPSIDSGRRKKVSIETVTAS